MDIKSIKGPYFTTGSTTSSLTNFELQLMRARFDEDKLNRENKRQKNKKQLKLISTILYKLQ